MYGIITALKQEKLFSDIEVLEFIDESAVSLLKVKAKVKDGSELYITELHTATNQKYSYHWQKENGDIIIRWDNAPHYPALKTFPYHVHESGIVKPSHRITIEEVIEIIRRQAGKI